MAEPTIQLGGGNWAGKSDNLLGYYKEGERFYKQDFTFSRSTTGTYTDKDGYIQEMPYNLLQQSNDFDTTWGNTNSTESLDTSVLAPNGKYTSWKLQANSGTHYSFLSQTVTISGKVSFSVFMKKGTANTATMYLSESGNFGLTANLENGTITSVTGSNMVGSVESVGDGWYRFEIRHTTNDNLQNTVRIGIEGGSFGSVTYDGTENIYIYGAQLVKGTSAKTYFPTTTRLNMPRVDYLNNSNGSLILEPQRTNVVTESSDFSTYSSQNITTLANNSTSPDGTINANKATPNTANGQHRYTPSYSVTSSTKYAASVFAKKDGYNKIRITENATTGGYADFDLLNGQVLSTSNVDSAKIEDYGNGWYRCIMVETTGSTSFRFDIIVLDDDNNTSFVGDGTSSVLLWGAQLEAGSYATTLINTSGSSVTRNADACSITNVADRINSSEGVLYAEISALNDDLTNRAISLSDGTLNNGIQIEYFNVSNRIRFRVYAGGVLRATIQAIGITITNTNKLAFKWESGFMTVYINGAIVSTSQAIAATPTGLDRLKFDLGQGSSKFIGKANQIQVYSTALSNSELATLTT
jgi:hypothetical protein